MTLNEIIVYVFDAFLLTGISGSIFSIVWLALRRCLGAGHERLLVGSMRIGGLFYLFPVLFVVVLWSMGDNVLITPWLKASDPRVHIFLMSPIIFWIARVSVAAWGASVIVLMLWRLRKSAGTGKTIRSARKESSPEVLERYHSIKEHLGIHREIPLLRSKEFSVPCTVGIFRRKVILPDRTPEYTEKELEVIFAHELTHCKRFDVLFKAEFLLIRIIHAANPLVYLMNRLHGEYTENACDIATCEKMRDIFSMKEYVTVLLAIAVKDGKPWENSVAIAEKGHLLERRVRAMLRYQNGKRMKKQVTALITALLIAGSSMTAYAAGNGIVALQEGIHDATVVYTVEEATVWVNTLEERVISAEEEAANQGVVMELDSQLYGGKGGTFNWTNMPAGRTYMTTNFDLKAGDTVMVSVGITPDGAPAEVGLARTGFGGTSVSGSGGITHMFTAGEDGTYYVYVKNTSLTQIDVSGLFY